MKERLAQRARRRVMAAAQAAGQQTKDALGRRLRPCLAPASSLLGRAAADRWLRWLDLPAANRRLLRREHEQQVVHVRSFPEEITLATTIRCNKAPPCAICERNVRTREMEWDCPEVIIERLGPVLPHLSILYLHCSGEPLYYRGFEDLLRRVRPPTRVRFNTNGLLLSRRKVQAILDSQVVDVINISLDAATDRTYLHLRGPGFARVVKNLKGLLLAKQARKTSIPFVVINMCLMQANYRELVSFVELAHELGAGAVDLFHQNSGLDWRLKRPGGLIFDYKEQQRMNPEEHDALILQAHERGRELNVDMNFVGSVFLSQRGAEEKERVGQKIKELARMPRCLAPWSRAVVGVDGNVRLCYFHKEWDESVGNLIFQGFDKIWNGERAQAVREEFLQRGHARYCEKENHCMFLGRV